METTLLFVEKNDLKFNNQLRLWKKRGFNMLRALSMNEAIKLSGETSFEAVGINADNINYLPQLTILRECINVPIYIMTSKFSCAECRKAINAGANVYMRWDNSGNIIVRAFTPNKNKNSNKKRIFIIGEDNISIYPEYRQVFINDIEIFLRKKEFDILYYLAINKDKVLTFDQIILKVWGEEYGAEEHRLLWGQISNLRKKIFDVSNKCNCIECIKGVGYRLKLN